MRVWKPTGLQGLEAAYLSYAGWDLSSDSIWERREQFWTSVSSSVMFISALRMD